MTWWSTPSGPSGYVTCAILRYHPAVIAQRAATVPLLAEGRFVLGLGSGENLNEHVVGHGWPALQERQAMLAEAIEVIRKLHMGELVDHNGEYFQVDSARIWGRPEQGVGIGVAVAGERAHYQFRWFAGGWSVNADLPTTAGFAAATQLVRPEDVADNIACGPDLDTIVESVEPFWEAGFIDVALVQVGGDSQERFLAEAAAALLEKLRAAAPTDTATEEGK